MPPHPPIFEGLGAVNSPFLRSVAARAHDIMNDAPYFVSKIVQLVSDVVVSNGGQLNGYDFTPEVTAMLDASQVRVKLASCQDNSLRQEIRFSLDWMAHAQEASDSDRRHHFVLAVIKYFHEFAHTLTLRILEIDKVFRQVKVPKQITPTKVGTKKEIIINTAQSKPSTNKFKWMGDMGFRLEEIMFGRRIYADFMELGNWDIISQIFCVKLQYSEAHAQNLKYAEFVHESILPQWKGLFYAALTDSNSRDHLFLEDTYLTAYAPLANVAPAKPRGKKRKRSAPLISPMLQTVPLGGEQDFASFKKNGFADVRPKEKGYKA